MQMSTADTKGLMSSKKGVAESTMACQRKMCMGLSHRLDRICVAREEREDV